MSDDTSKHEAARQIADAALRAERSGDTDRADLLMEQAERSDPSAVIDVAGEREDAVLPAGDVDEELSVESETVQPGSDAPSRAGITGTGSGADNQGL